LPAIAITSGEPAGVGPEICLRLLERVGAQPLPARLVVLADRSLLVETAAALSLSVVFRDWHPASSPQAGVLDLIHLPLAASARPGLLDPANARYVLALLDRALGGCRSGEFAAMVTAPVHKGVINDAGIPFTGHTEYLAEQTHTPRVVMMLAGGGLRVALATTHLPLKTVSSALTQESLEQTLRILHADLGRKYGIDEPRILVTGLNPHAGGGGYLGREEIEVIAPAVQRLQGEGVDARGPYSPDTVFIAARRGDFDAVVSMYHDQGQIAMKLMGFERGVTLHGGLPVPVATSASGSAYDIAGRGIANVEGLQAAFDLCVAMAAPR